MSTPLLECTGMYAFNLRCTHRWSIDD